MDVVVAQVLNSPEFRRRFCDPVLDYILARLYPYLLAVAAIFCLTFIFVCLILVLIVQSVWSP